MQGIWLLDRGWHVEIALPVAAVTGPLVAVTRQFPGAAVINFGFGKRDFIMQAQPGLGTWLAGPLPGPAVLEVTGRRDAPLAAIFLPLAPEGMAALRDFLWRSIAVAPGQGPIPVNATGLGQSFYPATRRYSLEYTCNTWVAEALNAAGLPVRPDGVRLARGVLAQAVRVPGACANALAGSLHMSRGGAGTLASGRLSGGD